MHCITGHPRHGHGVHSVGNGPHVCYGRAAGTRAAARPHDPTICKLPNRQHAAVPRNCLLLRKPGASCFLPPASCLLPSASCLLSPASCLLPLASCLPPFISRLLRSCSVRWTYQARYPPMVPALRSGYIATHRTAFEADGSRALSLLEAEPRCVCVLLCNACGRCLPGASRPNCHG